MTDSDDADARIAELEATVDGLTNELVDLQERVRELEAELFEEEAQEDQSVEEAQEDQSVEALFAQADGGPEESSTAEDVETIGDDIIIG